jgi:protein-S-isoprenylcysteine O-methyltransferase Ste14
MDERMRPPRHVWPVFGSTLVLMLAFLLLVGQTHRVTWYEAALLAAAGVLMVWGWALLLPSLVHRLRPSSYEHKSTTGERVVLGVLWAALVGVLVTTFTGPWWVRLPLLVAFFVGLVLLIRRQKQRIRRSTPLA